MEKITFKTYEEIKETYDKGNFDIWWKEGKTLYEVIHIGSTILCYDADKKRGMGAINNFDIKGFYGIEKPKPVIVEEIVTEEG